jgi:hypothetical protein
MSETVPANEVGKEVDPKMAAYLASQIIAGKLSYLAVFSRPTWKPYQEAVDDILVAEGREDLIVPIPA